MAFDLSQYQTVDERIHMFWEKYPNGRLHAEIYDLQRNELGQAVQVIIRAEAYTDREDICPVSVDYAEETFGSNQVNRTSFIENAVTSAYGRCLATLGFSPKGENKRPSQIEMTKVQRVPATGQSGLNNPDMVEEVVETDEVMKAITQRCNTLGITGIEEIKEFLAFATDTKTGAVTAAKKRKLLTQTKSEWEAFANAYKVFKKGN